MNRRTALLVSIALVCVLLLMATFTPFTGFWNILAFLYGLSSGTRALQFTMARDVPKEGTPEHWAYMKKAVETVENMFWVDVGMYSDIVFACWAAYSEHYFVAFAMVLCGSLDKGFAMRYESTINSHQHTVPFEEKS